MRDPGEPPRVELIKLHWRTYIALKRIRDDYGPGTFDLVVKDLIGKAYPGQYDLD